MPSLIRVSVLAVLLQLSACKAKEPLYQEQSYVFGTLVEVSVYGVAEPQAREAVSEVMHEFQRLHEMLHAWRPSELSELNAAIAKGQSAAVSDELANILEDAKALSAESQGLFNPAIGGLIRLWGFQADEFKPVQPSEKDIAQWVAANPRMSDLTIVRGRVQSTNKSAQLDLGGYAKGYALDRAAAMLRKRGISSALVNIGGNIMALGKHGKRAWRVGIQHPRKAGALATMELQDGEAIGTSGDYQRYFMIGTVRFCHLINPHSGYPMQGVQSVTVLTSGVHAGVLSDVASKPLFLSGAPGWRNAAKDIHLPDAMLVDEQGLVHITPRMRKRIEFTDRNTKPLVEP